MPGLTVDTSSSHMTSQDSSSVSQSQFTSRSRSASPVRPPYSPITPTLEPARLATSATGASQNAFLPHATYTHSQAPQTAIAQPPPVPITLDENPDAIALKSAISILQLQARNATADIRALQRIKERAVADPEAFARALASGEVASKPDPLVAPPLEDSGDEEGEEGDEGISELDEDRKGKEKNWGKLPTAQNIVRCPPINWTQYAVVGDSLDKLHKDQQARPTEGTPQILQPDGSLAYGSEGQRRREDLGVAAPYQPGKDKIDRMGTRKGGKR
jgi:hypothetical protein